MRAAGPPGRRRHGQRCPSWSALPQRTPAAFPSPHHRSRQRLSRALATPGAGMNATVTDLGTLAWVDRTDGRLSGAERRALLGPAARTHAVRAAGRLSMLVGLSSAAPRRCSPRLRCTSARTSRRRVAPWPTCWPPTRKSTSSACAPRSCPGPARRADGTAPPAPVQGQVHRRLPHRGRPGTPWARAVPAPLRRLRPRHPASTVPRLTATPPRTRRRARPRTAVDPTERAIPVHPPG